MKNSMYSIRNNFKLHEIALLMLGHDVDKYGADTERLLKEPPQGFQALYGRILEDACYFLDDYEQIQIDPDIYRPVYELQTDKPDNLDELSFEDGLNISASRYDINSWIKRHAELGRPLPDKFFTVTHTFEAEQKTDLNESLGKRERSSLYRIIAVLKHLLRNRPASEKDKPLFKSDAALIEVLENEYKEYGEGISKSNLTILFPESYKLTSPPLIDDK